MNYCLLIGRLTKAPELKYVGEKKIAVCKFALAVDRRVKKGQEKAADFFNVTIFGKQAENCVKYTEKGRLIAVKGTLRSGKYQNKDGVTIYTTDVIADEIKFLEWAKEKIVNDELDEAVSITNDFSDIDDEVMEEYF